MLQGHRDDLSILDSEVLYRYLHPTHWIRARTGDGRPISSAFMSFERSTDGISAYSAALLAKEGVPVYDILPDQSYGLVSLTVGNVREEGCGVIYDPNDERPVNFAHMLILEPDETLSRGKRRRLSLALIDKLEILRPPQQHS